MKRCLSAILAAVLLCSMTACSPSTKSKTVSVDELSSYTIVYPQSYKDWQMTEVELLRDIIEHITGTRINAVPDSEPEVKNEIIFASSARETSYDNTVDTFESRMDYIIAIDGDDIVLGGQNYYSDMRAAYDFINNYIGYDDIEDEYSEPQKQITGVNSTVWKKPELYLMGSNLTAEPFTEVWHVKDFVDCNFNLLQIMSMKYTDTGVRDVATWCARFGIELFYYPATDREAKQVIIPCEEDLIENPAVWGLYVKDEPSTEEENIFWSTVVANAKERFDKYGWTIYINVAFNTYDYNDVDGWNTSSIWRKFYSDLDILSFDAYPYQNKLGVRNRYLCMTWEFAANLAKELGQELFIYIDAYNLANRGYCDKMFRTHAYLCLCFGADGIEYFQYGDASPYHHTEGDWTKGSLVNYDFSKNEYYYDAQKVNGELKKIMPIYSQYENVGAYVINPKEDDLLVCLKNPCDDFGVIEDVNDELNMMTFGDTSTFLVGCFEKKEGDGKAFIIMNFDALTDISYGTEIILPTKLKINGEKVTCYRGGEPTVLEPDEDGYYSFRIPNGECLFVTVD